MEGCLGEGEAGGGASDERSVSDVQRSTVKQSEAWVSNLREEMNRCAGER